MDIAIILNSQSLTRKIVEEEVIAADAGYKIALLQNKKIKVVIGDFDSAEVPTNLNYIQLNKEKDDTDGQVCLQYAIENGYKNIAIYGISGGRLDHQICNASLLVNAYKRGINAVGYDDGVSIRYLEKGKYNFKVKKGVQFSTISFGKEAILTNGNGIKYPLNNLKISSSGLGIGISNVAIDEEISFEILDGGILLFIYDLD